MQYDMRIRLPSKLRPWLRNFSSASSDGKARVMVFLPVSTVEPSKSVFSWARRVSSNSRARMIGMDISDMSRERAYLLAERGTYTVVSSAVTAMFVFGRSPVRRAAAYERDERERRGAPSPP